LLAIGKPELAAAVGRAKALHCDMESRYHAAVKVTKFLSKLEQELCSVSVDLKQYVTQNRGPWLNEDLYPKERS